MRQESLSDQIQIVQHTRQASGICHAQQAGFLFEALGGSLSGEEEKDRGKEGQRREWGTEGRRRGSLARCQGASEAFPRWKKAASR